MNRLNLPSNNIIDFSTKKVIGRISLPEIKEGTTLIYYYGDSMEPKIQGGDLVAIREVKNLDELIYGRMYLLELDEYIIIRYIRKHELYEDNCVTLQCENPQYDDIKINKSRIKSLYVIENIISIKRFTLV